MKAINSNSDYTCHQILHTPGLLPASTSHMKKGFPFLSEIFMYHTHKKFSLCNQWKEHSLIYAGFWKTGKSSSPIVLSNILVNNLQLAESVFYFLLLLNV